MGGALRVGVIGVGNISAQYFAQLPALPQLRLTAVADMDAARAEQAATAQGVTALSVDELLASPDVDVVLNLTIPARTRRSRAAPSKRESTCTARSRSR